MIARISGFHYSSIRCLAFAVLITTISASAAVVDVSVVNNRFEPASVNIQINDEVRWTWAPEDGGSLIRPRANLLDCGIPESIRSLSISRCHSPQPAASRTSAHSMLGSGW